MSENLIGKVAKCHKGEIGIITHRVGLNGNRVWRGIKFNGDLWESKKPTIISDNLNQYLKKHLLAALIH